MVLFQFLFLVVGVLFADAKGKSDADKLAKANKAAVAAEKAVIESKIAATDGKPLLTSEKIEEVRAAIKQKKIVPDLALDKILDFYIGNRRSTGGLQDSACLEQKGYKIRSQDPKQKKKDLYSGVLNENCFCIADFTRPKSEKRGTCFLLNKDGIESIETFPLAHGSGSIEKDGMPTTFTNKLTPTGTTLSGLHLTGVSTMTFGGKEKSVGPYQSTGLSLYGIEESNWTASAVGKVTHGAPYVTDDPVTCGHSLGCPAMPMATAKRLLPRCQGQAAWYNYTLDDRDQKISGFRSCRKK